MGKACCAARHAPGVEAMGKLVSAIAIAASVSGIANAQPYPSRSITLAMPFAAGGPGDTLARILAEHMKDSLGQTVIVENVTGAAGSIGAGRVARAAPDGYTLISATGRRMSSTALSIHSPTTS